MNDERGWRREARSAARRCCWLALACALGVATTNTGIAADEAELLRSVEALSSEEFAEREAATAALIAAGEAAIPLVAVAASSNDRETSYRGMLVLRRLTASSDGAARRSARRALGELAKSGDGRVARIAGEALRSVLADAARQLQSSGGTLTRDERGGVRAVNFAHRGIHDAALAPLDDVEPVELNLTHTAITDAALERLATHTQLELLNLMATKVTDDGMQHVAGLTAMRTFSVERTAVTDAGMKHLKDFAQLKVLYVGGSKVTGAGLKHVERLPIEYLSFAYSPVDDAVVEHIVRLKHLKTLGLDDTKVTDACLPALSALANLEVLWLDNCAVTDAAVPHLKRLAKLKKLHVKNTKMSLQGYLDLNRDLDGVEIVGSPTE